MYEKIDAYVRRLIRESTPERTVWNVEKIRQGKPADWNYIDGCMMTALLSLAEITGDSSFSDFAEHFIDHFIDEDGRRAAIKKTVDTDHKRIIFELETNEPGGSGEEKTKV